MSSRLYDFCMIIECQNEIRLHVFENYIVINTGRKMDENQGDFREEQRAYCKIRGFLGKSASEIKSILNTVYRENTLL